MSTLNPDTLQTYIDGRWDKEIVPNLTRYIEIPAKSPGFDADWEKHGHIERVVRDAADWVLAQKVAALQLEIIKLPGRTPVLFFEIPASGAIGTETGKDTVLMYGHLDKQPEFS